MEQQMLNLAENRFKSEVILNRLWRTCIPFAVGFLVQTYVASLLVGILSFHFGMNGVSLYSAFGCIWSLFTFSSARSVLLYFVGSFLYTAYALIIYKALFVKRRSFGPRLVRLFAFYFSPWIVCWFLASLVFFQILAWYLLLIAESPYSSHIAVVDQDAETKRNYFSVGHVIVFAVVLVCGLFSFLRSSAAALASNTLQDAVAKQDASLAFSSWFQFRRATVFLALKLTVASYAVFASFGDYFVVQRLASIALLPLPYDGALGFMFGLLKPDVALISLVLSCYTLQLFWFANECLMASLCQSYEFPIPNLVLGLNSPNELYLQVCMTMTSLPLARSLAFLDFSRLSRYSHARRQLIFAITQPGGHPRNWDDFAHISLSLLGELHKEILIACNFKAQAFEGKLNQINATPLRKYMQNVADDYRPNGSFASVGPTNNGCLREAQSERAAKSSQMARPTSVESAAVNRSCFGSVISKMDYFGISAWLLSANAVDPVLRCFSDLNIHCWNIEGLSNLAIASLTEDAYGVVQKDLPRILGSLLELSVAFERLCRLGGHFPPRAISQALSLMTTSTGQVNVDEERLKLRFHFCLSSNLAAIVRTFGRKLNDVSLTNEQRSVLKKFAADHSVVV